MRKFGSMTALAAAMLLAGASVAMAKSDKAFLRKAQQGDMAEVQIGNLALQRAGNADVKAFAQMLVTDHGDHQKKVEDLGKQVGAKTPEGLSRSQQAVLMRLGKLNGDRFDRQFIEDMIKDHRKDIDEYKKQAKGSGPVADLAKATLPTLEKHLQTVQGLRTKVSSTAK